MSSKVYDEKIFNMWPKPRHGKPLIKVREYEDGAEYMEIDKYLAHAQPPIFYARAAGGVENDPNRRRGKSP